MKRHEVPQNNVAGSTSFPTPWVPGHQSGSQCCAEVKGFLRSQTKCKWQRSGTAHEAFEHSTAETAHEVRKYVANLDIGLASVPKVIEDNTTMNGMIDVHGDLVKTQKGSSL